MAIQGVATYNALKSWAKSRISLFLATVASFCLGLIGVVSMQEDGSVHNGKLIAQPLKPREDLIRLPNSYGGDIFPLF